MPYKDLEKGQQYKKEYNKRYRQRLEYKTRVTAYRNSPAGKAAQYRFNHSERGRLRNILYNQSPLGKINTMKKNFRFRQNLRFTLITMLGGKCVSCGFEDYRALEIDHKNDDGCLDKVRFNGDDLKQYIYYRDHPNEATEKLQILCSNHHSIKTFESILERHLERISNVNGEW